MGGENHPLAPLGLVLLALVVRRHHIGLVVGKEHHIRPLLHHGGHLLAQLHLPAVIGTHLIRLLKLPHFGVSRHNDIHSGVNDLRQGVQQPPEFLLQEHIALAVAEVLDALLLILITDHLSADHLRPVCRIQHQGLANTGGLGDLLHLIHKLLPGLGFFRPLHVHVVCTTLGVDEHRVWELGCKGGLANAFRPVNDHLLGLLDPSA